MASVEDVLKRLEARARPDQVAGMARYGMSAKGRMGVSVPDMRKIAKEVGKDHTLALKLWKTGSPEAKILAAMVGQPEKLKEKEMEDWVKEIDSWDICDQVCMNLFEKSPFVSKKVLDWSEREEEFVKRAAFALIACLAWHDKELQDDDFINLFPIIKGGATDDRNFVKKAVNWALRHIGKRNLTLNKAAIKAAREIQQIDSKAARWIAAKAIKELESEAVQKRLQAKKK